MQQQHSGHPSVESGLELDDHEGLDHEGLDHEGLELDDHDELHLFRRNGQSKNTLLVANLAVYAFIVRLLEH